MDLPQGYRQGRITILPVQEAVGVIEDEADERMLQAMAAFERGAAARLAGAREARA